MAMITVAFINLNEETIAKTCKSFWNGQEAIVEANGDFFE